MHRTHSTVGFLGHGLMVATVFCLLMSADGRLAAADSTCVEDKADPVVATNRYDAVFLGQVVRFRLPVADRPSLQGSAPHVGPIEVDLEVIRAWKGAVRDRVTIVTGDAGDVAFPFQMTASYVVWAVADLPSKHWLVPRCSRTRLVTQSVPDDRAGLDAWAELAPLDIPPSAPALICCCGVEIRSATDDLPRYDAVFIGDVVESRSCSKTWGSGSMRGATGCEDVSLLVRRVFRGSLDTEVSVRAGGCAGNPLTVGHRFLVWSRLSVPGEPLQVSPCATGEVDKPGIAAWVKSLEAMARAQSDCERD